MRYGVPSRLPRNEWNISAKTLAEAASIQAQAAACCIGAKTQKITREEIYMISISAGALGLIAKYGNSIPRAAIRKHLGLNL